jgi:hypothetical protein
MAECDYCGQEIRYLEIDGSISAYDDNGERHYDHCPRKRENPDEKTHVIREFLNLE